MKDQLNEFDPVFSDPVSNIASPGEKRHSGPGIASFIVSIIALVGYIIGFYVIFKFMNSMGTTELTEEDIMNHASITISGFVIGVSLVLTIISLILSIIGISLKNRKRLYAVLGLGIAAAPALLFTILSLVNFL
ncbi:hypothetical protein J2Z69_003682 [Paenibacillus shirakamiensis]|uniref:DUF4064 domain-containing protein n=1 Tax=Paenibacillus shirakamiensis TaxID=1265935 RepID=A0ABS4JLL8_9BACL|nr:hypothetical protein [Paenibacillus shirakamiensis]MBP2002596.1 hypothetical protein [Paenibacillus shirakamiensis]